MDTTTNTTTTSTIPVADEGLVAPAGAAAGGADLMPWVWAVILLAILGAVAWGIYRYAATTDTIA